MFPKSGNTANFLGSSPLSIDDYQSTYLDHIEGVEAAKTEDFYYMNLAIEEAKKGLYTTRPNPAVGCIIVKND